MIITTVNITNPSCSGSDFVYKDFSFHVPGNSTVGIDIPAQYYDEIRNRITEKGRFLVAVVGTTNNGEIPATKIDNLAGDGAPSVDDDGTVGYWIDSVWIDVTSDPREAYLCVDASEGAAVWLNLSLELGDLSLIVDGGALA